MFPAHCDTLKKYEQKFLSYAIRFCVHGCVREKEIDGWQSVNLNGILRLHVLIPRYTAL